MEEILFFAENADDRLTDSTYEVAGVGRDLADKSGIELAAVLIGPDTRSLIPDLGEHGVDHVYICEDDRLAGYAPEAAVQLLATLIGEQSPLAVLFAETTTSADYAARLAARLRVAFAPRTTSVVRGPDGRLKVTCLGYADQLQANLVGAKIITLQSGIGNVNRAPRSPRVDVCELVMPAGVVRVQVIKTIKADPRAIPLRQAEFIVSGGNGVRNFELLWKLAERLGASVGGSRVVCDDGRLERERQIGESGVTVKPRCYLAFGISGASQHLRGIQESKLIIAVNTDRFAPLMKLANMAVVADAEDVMSAMLSRLGERVT